MYAIIYERLAANEHRAQRKQNMASGSEDTQAEAHPKKEYEGISNVYKSQEGSMPRRMITLPCQQIYAQQRLYYTCRTITSPFVYSPGRSDWREKSIDFARLS